MTFLSKIDNAKTLIKTWLDAWDKCIVACSFGKDSMVLYHLCRSIKKDIPVFSVMTPFKPAITLKYKKEMEKYYGMNLTTYCQKERKDIHEWWKSNPSKCCKYYKVDMTKLALKHYDVWFTGLRKSEGALRAEMKSIVSEDKFGKAKVNPILDFTERDIWRYLALYQIPANPLYKEGYRSLGCAPCSVKELSEDEPERQGRWQGTKKQGGECGIHSSC